MAVSASECKCTKMMLDQSLSYQRRNSFRLMCLPWTIVFILSISTWTQHVSAADMNCATVKYTYEERGFSGGVVPKNPLSGSHLRICPQGMTCCTEEMEDQLSDQSRQEFDRAVKETLNKLAMVLKTRAQKFDEFFKELLTSSKREFHEMFKKTYGIIYEQNSYVFTDMFEELEKYYAKGQVDLSEAMENFFSTLYLKIFTVMNGQYHFDDKYLGCVGEHMKDLKPFGDVPHKLSIQLKRSFIATRTFSQALTVSSEVVIQMQKINPSPNCVRALMKMTGCPHCQGLPEVKACSNYCINVMKGCLAYQAELNTEWNNFVDQMEKVSERLLGPFNIEMVVEPINIKISEAIMNFQENGQEISNRVFQGCGKPILGRRRRSAEYERLSAGRAQRRTDAHRSTAADDSGELHFEEEETVAKYDSEPSLYSHIMNKRRRRDAPPPPPPSKRRDTTELEFESLNFGRGGGVEDHVAVGGGGPTLDRLVKDIRAKVRDSKQFWANLPYTICNDDTVAASPATDDTCWNGAMKAKYEPQITGDGITNQITNPEVIVDVNRPSSLLNEQLFALKTITSKLKNAYQGMDVEWIDNEEPSYGSGSGSGGGGIVDSDDEGGDDDDDQGAEGSGGGGRYNVNRIDARRPQPGNDEDNNLHPIGTYNRARNTTSGAGSSIDRTQGMSLTRAVTSYLLPIVVVWVGGMFSDWL